MTNTQPIKALLYISVTKAWFIGEKRDCLYYLNTEISTVIIQCKRSASCSIFIDLSLNNLIWSRGPSCFDELKNVSHIVKVFDNRQFERSWGSTGVWDLCCYSVSWCKGNVCGVTSSPDEFGFPALPPAVFTNSRNCLRAFNKKKRVSFPGHCILKIILKYKLYMSLHVKSLNIVFHACSMNRKQLLHMRLWNP